MNRYELNGQFGIGYTTKGEIFYFDLEDYDKIKDFTWHTNNKGYLYSAHNKHSMHRLILNIEGLYDKDVLVDHINRNTMDNRKDNLNIVSNLQNMQNKSTYKTNKSGMNGISIRPNGRYWVRISVNNKRISLGMYDTIDEAMQVKKQAELKYWEYYKHINT